MAQTTPQSSYISLYLRTKCMAPKTKKKGKIAHEKKGVCDSNHRPSGRWEDLSKNRNRIRCRKTTRARARLPAAESGETSEVRHVEQTPHRMVDLISSYTGRLRLKTWSKSDFSIAETWSPCYTYLLSTYGTSWQRNLGGMFPGL